MFVCGGFTICWIVCCGVTKFLLKFWKPAGRHFAAAPLAKPPKPRPPPPPPPRLLLPFPPSWLPLPPPAVLGVVVVVPEVDGTSLAKQAAIAARCAGVCWTRTRPVTLNDCPPVLILATIFG